MDTYFSWNCGGISLFCAIYTLFLHGISHNIAKYLTLRGACGSGPLHHNIYLNSYIFLFTIRSNLYTTYPHKNGRYVEKK